MKNDLHDIYNIANYIAKTENKELTSRITFKYKLLYTNWKQSDFTASELDHRGYLDLFYTTVDKLPNDLHIAGGLSLYKSLITRLPTGLTISGNLYLDAKQVDILPDDLHVGYKIRVNSDELLTTLRRLNPRFVHQMEVYDFNKYL